jgi:hypothetical protein
VVPGHGQRFREGDRHQGCRRAESDRRNARAGQGGTREPERGTSGGRSGDAYLQAAEDGLLETYTSPNVKDLQDWAQRITAVSQGRVSGVYGGILSLGYNTELQAKKKLPVPKCWKDLPRPRYKNEVMLGNPNSSEPLT